MSKYAVAVLLLVVFCLSAFGFEGFVGLTNGYFYDTVTGEPFVPHGIAYQTWNRPLGVWQTSEQIDYDLDEMVKMGANSVRIDIVWQHAEEAGDNIFNWENYDYFVQACEQRGLRIFALVGYQWPPNWFPDAWYTQHPPEWDAEGIYHPTRWQSDIINYEHPDARAQYAEWLAAVAGRYKDSKAIAGWIVGNESGYLGLWSGLLDGYDPESEAAFRAWCQAKYGTIEAANTAWGSSFTSFEQLSFVEQYRAYGVEGAIWADMVQWREDSIASFTAVGAVGAKSADTNHLISYSTVGMQWGEEDWRYHAEDRGKITEACLASNAPIDFFSVNNYPWSILGHESQNGHWGISYTKKVANVPVLYSETGFTSSETMWPGMNEFRQGPLVRNSLWESLEAGAVGTHIFSWMDRPWITDREKGFGILYADRRIKPAFWTSREAFGVMDQVDIHSLLMGSKDPEPDIAFLWTDANDSQYNRYECEMQQIAGAFERLGYEPGFINLDELADGSYTNFKVIVLPRNMRVEDEVPGTGKTVLDFLRENVTAAGVHVLASADLPGLQDFNGKPRAAFEQEVDDLFGIDASDIGGFECPMRRREYVSWYWTPIDVTFTEDVPAGLAVGAGYSYRPKLWKYSDEIKVTDGEVWAVMDSLRNKSFEDSNGTNVLGWNSWGITAVRENWGWQHAGAKMLQLWGENSGVWQDFEIVPFGRYTHSAYLRSNSDDALRNGKQGYVAIEFYDQNEQLLSVVESEHLAAATPTVIADLPAATAWWRMDETNWIANRRLEDSSGNGHLGTAYNGAFTTNAAAAVLAGVFDGVNDYIYVTNTVALQITNDLTLSFWVWPSTVGSKNAGLLDKSYGDEFTVGIQTDGSLGYLHGWTRSTGYYWNWYAMPAGSLTNGQWYHVAITRDAATRTMKSYLNGTLVAVTNYPDDYRYKPSNSTYPVYIGYSYAGYFKGRMDDVRIRPVALDATQVAAEWATPGTAVQPVNTWVKYSVDAIAPSNAFTARRMVRIEGSGDGSLYADHDRLAPALVVKDHGAAKAAIFLYSFGDNMPDGDGDGEMDIGPWKWRYDILGAIVRDYFGVQPKLQLKGTNACYALAEYRTCADGSTLWQIKNYLYDRFDVATWERLGGGAPQTFTLQSDLLHGKTIEALYGSKIVEENSDGTISITLDPDGMEMLLASGEGDGSGGQVSSDGSVFGQDNARTFSADDGPQSMPLTLQKAVSLGTALVISGDRGFYATSGGLYCRNLINSNMVWSFGHGEGGGVYFNTRSVAVAGSTVFVTTKNNYGAPLGAIYAVDARSGALKWKHATLGISVTPPVAKDGVVYFSGTGDRLHACDVESGQVLWESVSGVSASHYAPISMADGVVVAPAGGTVHGIDTTSGVTLWSRAVRYSYSEGPISIADGRVYVPRNHQYGFAVLDLRTGTQCWQRTDFYLDKFPGIAVDNGRMFVIGVPTSGVPSRALFCYDATQPGDPLWVLALTNVDTYAATPSVANGVVYLSANYSHMAVDAATGAILWSRYTGSNLSDAPVIKNRWVFFSSYGYSDGTPWPASAAASSNQVVRIQDAPSSVTPMGDKAYQVKIGYDCRDREDLVLKVAFMEVGDNGDGVPNEIYQQLSKAVAGAGQNLFWVWIPDADLNDSDYLSTEDGGRYQFSAWLETTGGARVAEARPQATILKWGVRPATALPTQINKGDRIEVPIEWENLNEYLAWENTPLARNDAFPSRVALFRSSKTEVQFPGQLDRANEVADWLESLGYSAGNPLDLSFDNIEVVPGDGFAMGPLVLEAETMATQSGGEATPTKFNMYGCGLVEDSLVFPRAGVYRMTIRAFGSICQGEWPLMELRVDGAGVSAFDVRSAQYEDYSVLVEVPAGAHSVGVAFINDAYVAPEDRNLYIDKVTIEAAQPFDGLSVQEAETMPTRGPGTYSNFGGVSICGNSYIEGPVAFGTTGDYEFTIRAAGAPAIGVWPEMEVRVDGATVATLTVGSTNYGDYTATVAMQAGSHTVTLAFVNDWYAPPEDRNLILDKVVFRDVSKGTILADDFGDGSADDWSRDAGCANWTVEDGALRASRIGNSDNILVAGSDPAGDCTVSADIRYNTQDPYFNDAELFVRYVDRDNFVKVGIRNFYGFWRLKYTVRVGRTLRSQGWIHEFTKATRPLEDEWHNLRVNVAGSTYTVFFDDEEVGSFTDANFASGRVGIGSSASQLGIWEPQKGYFFIDDDEYSFWAPEGKPQTNGYALNLDWGYLDAFYPTLVLPGTYVMSDAEVSNVTVWLGKGLRSLIATSGGIGMKDETGADAAGRMEPLFGVAGVVDTLGGVTAAVVDDDQHYITLDHGEGDILAAAGNAVVWPLPTDGLALGRVHNGTTAQPALIANVITNDPLSPKKVFCFNFDADTDGQLTGAFSNIAKRAFEWARGETYKVRLQLKYSLNPTNQALDLTLINVDGWLLTGSGTSTLIVDIPERGIMTGDNLYWVMYVYPWDANDPWLAHNGFYTTLNDAGAGYVSLAGKGLQIFGITDRAYAGRAWDMWAGYNTRGATCAVVFGIADAGSLVSEDNFNDGDLAGWSVLPEGNTQWSNPGDKAQGSSASGGQAMLLRDGVEVGDENITISYDAYCNGGRPKEQGLFYRGYILSIDTQGAWWQNNTVSNFSGIVTNADGSISYIITGGVQVFVGPAPLTTGKWQHVTVSIRDGEPTRKCDIYVDGIPYRFNMAMPGTNYASDLVGLVTPKTNGYMLVDNFRVADEAYSFATQKVVGAFVPTNAAQPTFWPFVPDYDSDWYEYAGVMAGGRNEWFAYLKGEGIEDRAGVAVYFAPRLMTENPAFPTNITAGSSVGVPIEWEDLDQLPVRMVVALQDGRTGAYYVQEECQIDVATGSGTFTVQVPDTAPTGDEYIWSAYMYPPGVANPWVGRIGADDTARSDMYGAPLDFEVRTRVTGTNGQYVVYSDWGLPVGTDAFTWLGTHNGAYTNIPAAEGVQSWRALLGSSTYAGWGVFYPNRAVYLDQFNYLKFWVKTVEPLKIEVEAPKGNKKTVVLNDSHWDPSRPDDWQEVTIPKSAFGFQWNLLYDVYGPFMATLVLPTHYGVDMLDENTAWVVSSSADYRHSVMRTTDDGGATWSFRNLPTNTVLRAVDFVDENTGWAVGYYSAVGKVFKTTDGGDTWVQQTLPTAVNYLFSVFALDAQTAWAGGSQGVVFRTTDGGATWTAVTIPAALQANKILFVDANNGWVVGQNRTLVRTTDGGATWTPVTLTSGGQTYSALSDVHFFDTMNGWVCGGHGLLARTSDGGITWTAVSFGSSASVACMEWVDGNRGYIAQSSTYGYVHATTNGGVNWSSGISSGVYYPTDMKFLDYDTGLMVGDRGSIAKCTGIDAYGRPTWANATPVSANFLIDHVRWTEKP